MDGEKTTMWLSQAVRQIGQDLSEAGQGLRAAVARYLTANGDEAVEQAYDHMLLACTPQTQFGDELLAALQTEVAAATVETLCEGWEDILDIGVRTTEADSVVGMCCVQLILRTQMLVEDMADVEPQTIEAVRSAAARQCGVYLYG